MAQSNKVEVGSDTPKRLPFMIPLDQLAGYEGVKTLAKLIREYERTKGNTYKTLARKANLYPKTVARIADRTTKAPRMQTCIMIFMALGFTAARFE